MTPLFKSLLGIGLVGGGAGLSVGGYYLSKSSESTTLLEKFKSQNLQILDYWSESDSSSGTGNYVEWADKVTKYKTSAENKNKFSGLDMSSSDAGNQHQQKLREECKKHLEKPLKEISKTEGLEEKVKFWCTKSDS